VNLPYSLRIALRHLLSLRRLSFISIITSLSYLGLTTGVAALICVTGIFNGFRDVIKDLLLRFDPHIRITAQNGNELQNIERLQQILQDSVTDIKSLTVLQQGRIIMSRKETMQAAMLNTLPDQQDSSFIRQLSRSMIFGSMRTGWLQGLPGIVIGAGLADKLRVLPGDTVQLYSPAMLQEAAAGFYRPEGRAAIVTGIFQVSGGIDYDKFYCFASSDIGNTILGSRPTTIDIRLLDQDRAEYMQSRINPPISTLGARSDTWFDLHQELYSTMEFERTASFIVISLVALVSAFNVLVSLWLTVHRKKRDIGVLMSIGVPPSQISRIFIIEGAIIGLSGTISGLLVGIGLCMGQQRFGWIALPNSIIPSLPVSLHMADITSACLVALFLSAIATIYPARMAAAQQITDSIRNE
jgi:lipoprotein-releasing system permease protein